MKVTTRDSLDNLTGEMHFDEPEIGYVAETISDPVKLKDFGFSKAIQGRAKQVAEAANDDDPEFVVVRTEEGWSGSGRLWTGEVLQSIAEQLSLNQPVGHLGHIPDDQASTAFPEPQTTWIGALTKTEPSQQKDRAGEMVRVIYTAGYNLPGAKVRTYLKTGAVRGTSWWGRARQVPIPGKGVKVEDFVLLALDWARKLSEGMPTSRVVALAREMNEGGNTLDKELAQVTPEEFKEQNPNGYKVLVTEITAEKDKTIGEMQEQIDAAEADKSLLDEIRGVLKIAADADPLEKIAHLVKRLGERAKVSVDEALDKLLAEKVPDEATRKLVKRLLPVAEMEEKAGEAADVEAANKIVSEMLTAAFDSDEMIQQYVSEQAPPIVRRREEIVHGNSGLDKSLEQVGVKRERVKMGG